MIQIGSPPPVYIYGDWLQPFMAEFLRIEKYTEAGNKRERYVRYQAPAIRFDRENSKLLLWDDRLCFVARRHQGRMSAEWCLVTVLTVRFLDDGSERQIAAGAFRKLRLKSPPVDVMA